MEEVVGRLRGRRPLGVRACSGLLCHVARVYVLPLPLRCSFGPPSALSWTVSPNRRGSWRLDTINIYGKLLTDDLSSRSVWDSLVPVFELTNS